MSVTPASDPVIEFYTANPYTSGQNPAYDPIRMATAVRLNGLEVPSIAGSRLIDVGCSTGQQLLADAEAHPDMQFVGIDSSPVHIEHAQQRAKAMGLGNVELHCASLATLDDSLGRFDYVVFAGVYSWVPAAVRSHIMPLCARLLAPHGIAAVSFNVNPGWATRMVVRDLIRTHPAFEEDPESAFAFSNSALSWIIAQTQSARADDSYRAQLRAIAHQLQHNPSQVFYEIMAPECQPLELHEVVADAARAGLRYTDDGTVASGSFIPPDRSVPTGIHDVFAHQTYDRVHGTMYRIAYLVDGGREVGDPPDVDEICDMYVRSSVVEVTDEPAAEAPDGRVSFRFRHHQAVVHNRSELVVEAYRAMERRWPAQTLVGDIAAEVAGRCDREVSEVRAVLAAEIAASHRSLPVVQRPIELYIEPVPIAIDVGDRPRVRRIVRVLLEEGSPSVPGFAGTNAPLNDVLQAIGLLLDGTHTIDDIAEEILHRHDAGDFDIRAHDDAPQPTIDKVRDMVRQSLDLFVELGLLALGDAEVSSGS
jgi:SAM-dependent methyltransferase